MSRPECRRKRARSASGSVFGFFCSISLCVLSSPLSAQSPNEGAAKTGVIQGTVVENITGRPLARAAVRLEPAGAPGSASFATNTDGAGVFRFDGLAPGAYFLTAQRRGFALTRYGQRDWNSPGTPIAVAAGGYFVAAVRLWRLGVLEGDVLDENGVGIPGVFVAAVEPGARARIASSGTTDERGHYRIAGLTPREYFVRSNPRTLEDGSGLLPGWAGGATRTDAVPVRAALDAETHVPPIQPVPGILASLEVSVSGLSPAVSLRLRGQGESRSTTVGAPGSALFAGLDPGTYQLLAESAGPPALSAEATVTVTQPGQAAMLALAASPILTVTCTDGVDGAPAAGISIVRRRLDADSDAAGVIMPCGTPAPLPPGEYEIAAIPSSKWYVAEVTGASPSAEAYAVRLSQQKNSEVRVRVARDAAGIKGVVRMQDGSILPGALVWIRPMDRELAARIGGVRTTRAANSGDYSIQPLPPGDYEIGVLIEAPADFSTIPVGRGRRIRLEGAKTTVETLVLTDQEG